MSLQNHRFYKVMLEVWLSEMDEFLENYEQARLNYVGCIVSPEFSDTH